MPTLEYFIYLHRDELRRHHWHAGNLEHSKNATSHLIWERYIKPRNKNGAISDSEKENLKSYEKLLLNKSNYKKPRCLGKRRKSTGISNEMQEDIRGEELELEQRLRERDASERMTHELPTVNLDFLDDLDVNI